MGSGADSIEREEEVSHPAHYNQFHGAECIDIVEHMNFNLGNAMKYLWRAGYKDSYETDLKKAIFYIDREIERSMDR